MERKYVTVATSEDGTSVGHLVATEVVPPLPDGPLALGESVALARFDGEGVAAELSLRRGEHSFAVRATVRLITDGGGWAQATTTPRQIAARDPFTRQPAGTSRADGYPFPPWEPVAGWEGTLGGDRYLVRAGRVEVHVARMTVETEDSLVDVPIDAATGAYVVALRGKRTRDHYFRFFDAGGDEIAAWGERRWHYAKAKFVSRRGSVFLVPTDVMRERLFGDPDVPAGWGFEPTRRDERLWRAHRDRRGVFVQLQSRITLRWADGSTEEVYGDVSQPRWIPWAHPQNLARIDWREVYEEEMNEDETELRILGASRAASQVRGPRSITYDEPLQRLLQVHRLIAALQQRPMA